MQSTQMSNPLIREHLNVVWFYILARLLLGLGILLWVVFSVRFDTDFQLPANLSFYTLGGVFALMGTMAFFSTQHGEKHWFVWLQFVVDALFVSMLLCSGGSYHNPFVLLFALNILAAMSLGWAKDVLLVTILDICCYILVQYAGAKGILNWAPIVNYLTIYVKVTSEIFGLALIGGLGMLMAEQQAVTNQSLREQILTTSRLRRRHIDVLNELPIALFVEVINGSPRLIPQNRLAEQCMLEPLFVEALLEERGRRFALQDLVYQLQVVDLSSSEKLLLVEDVTNLQAMEQTMAKEEQLAIVGRLSASLAHEIRNPIASLSGAVQLLSEQKQSRLHTIILREVHRINELVDLFLQSARSQHLNTAHQSVLPSLYEIAEAVQHDPRAQGVTLEILKKADVSISVDISKFRQVIWNLLLNSIQAGSATNIKILTIRDPEIFWIVVQDNGVGISPENLDKIVDPFFTTRAGGTGLGLFVVQQIVNAHGGMLNIESVLESGTTVRFGLPISTKGE
jgi:two-component system, NtrC family, sensor histidine kinase PilS